MIMSSTRPLVTRHFLRNKRPDAIVCDDDDVKEHLVRAIDAVQSRTGNRRVVYTVNTNSYDLFLDVAEAVKTPGVDYIYLDVQPRCFPFVDDEHQEEGVETTTLSSSIGWTVIRVVKTWPTLTDCDDAVDDKSAARAFLMSRDLKALAAEYFRSYAESLYIDSNVRINRDLAPLWEHALNNMQQQQQHSGRGGDGGGRRYCIAAFRHPGRKTIDEEFREVAIIGRLTRKPVSYLANLSEQYARYQRSGALAGTAREYPLTWNNVLFRRHDDEDLKAAMRDWYDVMRELGQRDQLSLLPCLWGRGVSADRVHAMSLFDDSKPTDELHNKDGTAQYPYFSRLNHYLTRPFAGLHMGHSAAARRLVFVKQFPQLGSNLLRCDQVAVALSRLGYCCDVVDAVQQTQQTHHQRDGPLVDPATTPYLRDLKDADVFFVGRFATSYAMFFKKSRQKNVRIIYDVVDKLCELDESKLREIVTLSDAIICPNRCAEDRFRRLGFAGATRVIHHHWDPNFEGRLRVSAACLQKNEPTFGFLGGAPSACKNMLYMPTLVRDHGLRVWDTESKRDVTQEIMVNKAKPASSSSWNPPPRNDEVWDIPFDCHLSVRRLGSPEDKYKTDTKIATAALLGCPIITTPEAAATETLPRDYPYFTRGDKLEDVLLAMQRVRDTYGKEDWHKARRILSEQVRAANSLSNLAPQYALLFARMDGKRW